MIGGNDLKAGAFLILATLAVLVLPTAAKPLDSAPTAVADEAKGIVHVVCATENGPEGLGTGFFIAPQGWAVMPRHVLDGRSKYPGCDTDLAFLTGGWSAGRPVGQIFIPTDRCTESSLDTDLAVCCPDKAGVTTAMLSLDTSERSEGTRVSITGFALGFDIPSTTEGTVSVYRATSDNVLKIVIDNFIFQGDSGAPIYASDGKVIGMAEGTTRGAGPPIPDPSATPTYGYALGIPASLIRDYVNSLGSNFCNQKHP